MDPVLKWAGGKRQLLSELKKYIILNDQCMYFEPFIGGGAVLFDICPNNAFVSDVNEEIINTYIQIKNKPYALIKLLEKHKANHNKDYYYYIRDLDLTEEYCSLSKLEKAARFIYLNRTCYNGLYRVNSKGHFNVPIGRYKNPEIVQKDKIIKASKYFKENNIVIKQGDYNSCIGLVKANDVIYLDPPYDYEKDGFTSYTRYGFSRDDLQRLKLFCDRCVEKGAIIILSNNDTRFVNDLFSGSYYSIYHVTASRMINSDSKNRKQAKEVIIYGKNNSISTS